MIGTVCGPAPKGAAKWTLRLLENELKVVLAEPVIRETIRKALKTRGVPPDFGVIIKAFYNWQYLVTDAPTNGKSLFSPVLALYYIVDACHLARRF